jgi:hypothetical protein
MEPQIFWERNHLGPIPVYSRLLHFGPNRDRNRMNRFGMSLRILALALALAPGAVRASQQGVVTMKNWKSMDLCAKEAQTAFPDYSADSQAKRDAKLKECLQGKNLPPREPLAPGR